MSTCLVVDDSPVTRKIARRILERIGFHVKEAEDAEKAMAICRSDLPETILLDWNMTVMDGYEFLGDLLALPGGDQPRVVFCTAESDVAHRARARQGGACEQTTRPFDGDMVAEKFRAAGLLTFTVFPGSAVAARPGEYLDDNRD